MDIPRYDIKFKCASVQQIHNTHNPCPSHLDGSVCYPAYLKQGERGWILFENYEMFGEPMSVHRFHTSKIQELEYEQDKIIVHTENSIYTLEVVE